MILNISGTWEFSGPNHGWVLTAVGQGSVPGGEAKIPQAEQHGQNINY